MKQQITMDLLSGYSKTNAETGCIEWQRVRNPHGYGVFSGVFGGKHKLFLVHRVAYSLRNGDIPAGLCVLHKCDNPACLNPDHLFLGTRADNNLDRASKGRTNPARGAECWTSKLEQHEADLIRELYFLYGISQCAIAKQFGVQQVTVSQIVLGTTWNHPA